VKSRFKDSMVWLHTWSGLVVAWILFAVFLTGTLAYFNNEISAWMQTQTRSTASPEQLIKQSSEFLQQNAVDSPKWTIVLPTGRYLSAKVYWQDTNQVEDKRRNTQSAQLDQTGQALTLRETRGGNFFYRFHFDLYYMPVLYARWLIGICAMFMLVAIVTGVIIHKKIFKDFFTLQFFIYRLTFRKHGSGKQTPA